MKKFGFFIVLLTIVLSSLACGSEDTVSSALSYSPTSIPVGYPSNEACEVQTMETEAWKQLAPQISISKFTEKERKELSRAVSGEQATSVAVGTVGYNNGKVVANPTALNVGIGVPAFVVPAVQYGAQNWPALYSALANTDASKELVWNTLFHWTGHMSNQHNLAASGAWFNSVVKGAMDGTGVIYKFQNTEALRTQYLFVTKVAATGGTPAPWGVFLAENGAPITGYNTALNGRNVLSDKEAERFLKNILQRGYSQISSSELPRAIKDNWGTSSPPIYRFVWWSLAYQLEMYARLAGLSIAEAAAASVTWIGTAVTDFVPMFLVVPNCGRLSDIKDPLQILCGPAPKINN